MVVALLSLAALAPQALAQGNLDAACPGPHESLTDFKSGQSRWAQTFTAQASGNLTAAQVVIFKGGSAGDYVMQINQVDQFGFPTNSTLAATTIPNNTVPEFTSIQTGNFAAPAAVVAGQRYALVVTRPASDSLFVGRRTGNDCPGELWFSSTQTGTWDVLGLTGHDMVFAVFVAPPAAATPGEPGGDAGAATPDTSAGEITGAAADPRKFAVDRQGPSEASVPLTARAAKGTTFRYTLSEPAEVKFSIFREVKKKNKKKLKPVGAFVDSGEAGVNAKPFSGVIGGKKLKPGKHVARLTATDAAGNVSSPATIEFKVVAGG